MVVHYGMELLINYTQASSRPPTQKQIFAFVYKRKKENGNFNGFHSQALLLCLLNP